MWRFSWLRRCVVALVSVLAIANAHADVVDVTIDLSGLQTAPSVLAFDFVRGGSAVGNQVTLSTLTTNGAVASTSSTPDVTGVGPWAFGADPSSFFSELLVYLDPTGTLLSFSIDTTDVAAEPGGIADSFSLYILGTDLMPLVFTDEPFGSNALFQFDLGLGADGLRLFDPVQDADVTFDIDASHTPATSVPEPATAWLLAWLGAAVAVRRRGNRLPGRP